MKTEIHLKEFGEHGFNLTPDKNGYVHTSLVGWLCAPINWGEKSIETDFQKLEYSRERLLETLDAIREVKRRTKKWIS